MDTVIFFIPNAIYNESHIMLNLFAQVTGVACQNQERGWRLMVQLHQHGQGVYGIVGAFTELSSVQGVP